jgi:hypothetical protein
LKEFEMLSKLIYWLIGKEFKEGDLVMLKQDSVCKGISPERHLDIGGYRIIALGEGENVRVRRVVDSKENTISIKNLRHAI